MNMHSATAAVLVGSSLGLAAPAALADDAGTFNAWGHEFTAPDRVPQPAASAPRGYDVLSNRTIRGPGAYNTSFGAGSPAAAPVAATPRTRTINAWGANFDAPAY